MILDVFGEHPTWPDIKGHDLGADGKPCGGWPPRDEFPCMNYSWTDATCKGNPYEGATNWYRDSHRTDLGALCCNAGGCVPQEANISAIIADTKRWVAEKVPAGFSGNCVLDQEGYNAIATDVQFGECDWPHEWSNIYRNYSLALVRAQQPGLAAAQVAEIARRQCMDELNRGTDDSVDHRCARSPAIVQVGLLWKGSFVLNLPAVRALARAWRRPALWIRPPDCRPKVPQAGGGSAAGGPGFRHPVSLGLFDVGGPALTRLHSRVEWAGV
jgi:hypothetical protein